MHSRQSNYRRFFWLALLHVICGGSEAIAFQENPPDDSATKTHAIELPQQAIWRVGEFGKTPKANGIYRLQFSTNGKMLASRNRENLVAIYDTVSHKKLCEVSAHENNWIESIDFSPDSTLFITAAGSSEKVKIWNSQNGKLESEIETDAQAAYFSVDGKQILVFGSTHVECYSWPGVQLINQKEWQSDGDQRAAMSADGKLVVSYRLVNQQVYQTQIFDLQNRSKIELDGPTTIPKSVVISSNNLWVAAASHRDSKIWLCDLRDPHQAKYVLDGHLESIQSLAFSPDNRLLISSSWDEKAVVWDLLTRQPIGEFIGHTEHVNATACAPLNFTIATGASGSTDTSIIVWDLKSSLFPRDKTAKEMSFEDLWNAMGASSVKLSLSATAELIDRHSQFLDLLDERVKNDTAIATTVDATETIFQLDDPAFAVRENAMAHLMLVRTQVESELRRTLEQTISAEVRYRITKILNQPIERPKINFTDLRRWHRLILALEVINTPAAQLTLARIANGHPDIDVAQDADDAIQRNKLRASF